MKGTSAALHLSAACHNLPKSSQLYTLQCQAPAASFRVGCGAVIVKVMWLHLTMVVGGLCGERVAQSEHRDSSPPLVAPGGESESDAVELEAHLRMVV